MNYLITRIPAAQLRQLRQLRQLPGMKKRPHVRGRSKEAKRNTQDSLRSAAPAERAAGSMGREQWKRIERIYGLFSWNRTGAPPRPKPAPRTGIRRNCWGTKA